MIITKKAIAGFILLAMIVFPTVYYATPMLGPTVKSPTQTIDLEGVRPNGAFFNDTRVNRYYHSPLITLKDQFQTSLAVTIVLEVFTLICYLALKKLEPAINKAAAEAMQRMREQDELDEMG
jgi:hypothetical protein